MCSCGASIWSPCVLFPQSFPMGAVFRQEFPESFSPSCAPQTRVPLWCARSLVVVVAMLVLLLLLLLLVAMVVFVLLSLVLPSCLVRLQQRRGPGVGTIHRLCLCLCAC